MTSQQKESTLRWILGLTIPIIVSGILVLVTVSAKTGEIKRQVEINTQEIQKKADEKDLDRIYNTLDRIEEKLDKHMDK